MQGSSKALSSHLALSPNASGFLVIYSTFCDAISPLKDGFSLHVIKTISNLLAYSCSPSDIERKEHYFNIFSKPCYSFS